jgi:hypothetical protein
MTMFQPVSVSADRVMEALVAGLQAEFGHVVGEALAARFLAAEDADFHWDARHSERWLGTYECADGQELELDRIAIYGFLDGEWFTACMIIDGDEHAHGMICRRVFRSEKQARKAFAQLI